MELVIQSKRDERTLRWLIEQVGSAEVARACGLLAGARRAYPSNVAKALGLSPPRSLSCPTPEEARSQLAEILALLGARS
jgi:hypothetical protein